MPKPAYLFLLYGTSSGAESSPLVNEILYGRLMADLWLEPICPDPPRTDGSAQKSQHETRPTFSWLPSNSPSDTSSTWSHHDMALPNLRCQFIKAIRETHADG